MLYTDKWRDPLIDPLHASFPCGMRVLEVFGYPHAGNDVFGCLIGFRGVTYQAILKIARHTDANLENEWAIIDMLKQGEIKVPQVISYGRVEGKAYLATVFDEGKRLSHTLQQCSDHEIATESVKYMSTFGGNLGKIHSLSLVAPRAPKRRFHYPMSLKQSTELGLRDSTQWLLDNKPEEIDLCFVHGDHHHANILWQGYNISCTLDWELSGVGWKEFDLAWALIGRPSQRFLRSKTEQDLFLSGYRRYSSYNDKHLRYCMVMIYQYFYDIGSDDEGYKAFIYQQIGNLRHTQCPKD